MRLVSGSTIPVLSILVSAMALMAPANHAARNMLRYAARDTNQPPADLPANFDEQLNAMGY